MEKPVFWHQGLFLQPQHLQLSELCSESNFTPYYRYIKPYLYGTGRLEIGESALANHSFQIEAGEFWFADMTYAVLGDNAVIEPRSFKDALDAEGNSLTVYVGLKKYSKNGENVSVLKFGQGYSNINTRFITSERPELVNDLHQGDSSAQVKKMNYLLRIFFHTEKEELGNYELIPVAEIVRDGENISISKKFVPPCLSIHSSSLLLGRVRDIYNQVLSRGRELESHKKKRGIHNAEFGSKDMVYLLALRSFNTYIPVFSHMLEGQDVHPWEVYSLVRQFIGELSSFSENIDVFGRNEGGTQFLPEYDHNNLWECFSDALGLISALLNKITAGPEYIMLLEPSKNYFTAELKREVFEENNHYYLVIRTQEEPVTILDAVKAEIKIGTTKILPILIERALPGASLDYLPVPPQELPRRSDSIYFHIDNHGEQWANIEKEKNIGLYWSDPPEDVRVELMIVRRR
ncbi:MAG: type VI secretion system baseplate subunit TssK [Desulfosalsimonas sp.]